MSHTDKTVSGHTPPFSTGFGPLIPTPCLNTDGVFHWLRITSYSSWQCSICRSRERDGHICCHCQPVLTYNSTLRSSFHEGTKTACRRCTIRLVRFFNDTLNRPSGQYTVFAQLLLSTDKASCHVELRTEGCWLLLTSEVIGRHPDTRAAVQLNGIVNLTVPWLSCACKCSARCCMLGHQLLSTLSLKASSVATYLHC